MTKNRNEYMQKYRQENRKKIHEYDRLYKQKNKEKISKNRHKYYLNHEEKALMYNREYRSRIRNDEVIFYCLFCKKEYVWSYKSDHIKTRRHLLAKMRYEHND